VAYAGAEQLGGLAGLRILVVVVFAIAASLVWRLTAAAPSLIPRLLLAAVAMVVASGLWSERPYMVGFIGLCLVWSALDGRISHWWLVPTLWVWANSHGSFPLALVLVGAALFGTVVDQRTGGADVDVRREVMVLRSVVLGAVLAVLSPLGFDVLTFPLSAFGRSDTFGLIVEWQAPRFTSAAERAFLVLIAAAIVAVVRTRRWRDVLPVVAFVMAALIAQRNVVMAVPILVPVIAGGLPRWGALEATARPRIGRPLGAVAIGLTIALVGVGLTAPGVGLAGYPTHLLAFTDDRGDGRLVTQDFVGNLLEVLDGAGADVFMDDRVDMFPDSVVEDYQMLSGAAPGWDSVLDRADADAVVWQRADPLGSVLAADPRWQIQLSTAEWVLAVRR
jgi:hypothetical protein